MCPYFLSLIAIALISAFAQGADRLDQLFASWQKAQHEVKSLAIEFTLVTKENVFNQCQTAQGMFRLVRTPEGELFASYEITEEKPKDGKKARMSGLLHGGSIYLLDHEKKLAIRFRFEGRDLQEFLEKYWNPFVLLIDRKRAEEKCKLEIVKRDELYTYLAVKPKQVKRSGWFPDNFQEGRVILLNKAANRIPNDMPKRLWYKSPSLEYTFDIKSWRFNAADGPRVEEFVRPHDRPGWNVME